MEAHRLASYFPIMEDEKFEKFKEDIKENGQLEPIVTFDNQILDGLNRYRACTELGITPTFKAYGGKDPLHYVVSVNVHRRHMTASQLAMVATEMLPEFEEKAEINRKKLFSETVQGDHGPLGTNEENRSSEQVAQEFGISGKSVRRAKRVKEQAPEKVEAIIQGTENIRSVDTELRMKAEKERKDKAIAEGRTQKTEIEISIEETQFEMFLEGIISKFPKVPQDWNQDSFNRCKGYANIIINRLEVFNG